MLVSASSGRFLLREDVWQFVLLVVLDDGFDAHILQQLLRGLSVDGQANCIDGGLCSCFGWKLEESGQKASVRIADAHYGRSMYCHALARRL